MIFFLSWLLEFPAVSALSEIQFTAITMQSPAAVAKTRSDMQLHPHADCKCNNHIVTITHPNNTQARTGI